MQPVMGTETTLYDDFNDRTPTTLDPCDDIEAAGEDGIEAAGEEGADGADNTPAILDPCPECGRGLTRLADWIPPPATPEAAWHGWVRSCVATESSLWQWCPLTGWLTARVRVHWARRVVLPPPPATRISVAAPSSETADTFVGFH
jgi:hypothetical protein